MSGVPIKRELGPIDGTPEKRMFWSIISDYDLKTGLCELIDNALDIWLRSSRSKVPKILIQLDTERQIISVQDDVGGVKFEDLHLLLAPGGSKNDPASEVIGIFGVGSKRAGIALGEQVDIRTRFRSGQSLELNITREWLENEDWKLAAYEIPDIERGTTRVEISRLRRPFISTDIGALRVHFGQTYSWFIRNGCVIEVNGVGVGAEDFDNWSYPPGYAPKVAAFEVDFLSEGKVSVEIVVGLIGDRVPEGDNYGAYFYCNHRLIVKELRSREVGYFNPQEAGVPHPDASLCRGIVRLQGPARLMPWNSTKNGINTGHVLFGRVRATLAPLMAYYTSLSRRLKDDWSAKVFSYNSGDVEPVDESPSSSSLRSHLPPLPRAKRPSIEKLKSRNRIQIDRMPWTLGLIEAMGAIDVISKLNIETKNRIALILLDSNFEIALKEFIVHRTDLFPQMTYGSAKIGQLFQRRSSVLSEIKTKISIPQELIAKADHYYGLRNKFIHERATVDVTERDIRNYRAVVVQILKLLFGLSVPDH
ncbi:ATP-binding protein [Bradyrhizobium sp. HKCCYLS2033]|uniref:ATP-binding protein n=1 Tax=Bradyrhizobium TaxID=374 RepID=UPI003EBE40D0